MNEVADSGRVPGSRFLEATAWRVNDQAMEWIWLTADIAGARRSRRGTRPSQYGHFRVRGQCDAQERGR